MNHKTQRHQDRKIEGPGRQTSMDTIFGKEIGIKQSAVGATHNYTKEDLQDKLILGLVNMPPKKIGPFFSEFLTLGVSDEEGKCILISPDKKVSLGAKLF